MEKSSINLFILDRNVTVVLPNILFLISNIVAMYKEVRLSGHTRSIQNS